MCKVRLRVTLLMKCFIFSIRGHAGSQAYFTDGFPDMPLSHATDALMHGYGAIVTYLPYHSLARSWLRVSNWCVNGI